MHAWLKRAVAGLLSAVTLLGGGLLTAGTANADEIRMPDIGKTITSLTASAATTYPRELVNGGFDYLPAGGWNVISPKLNTSRGKFTSVDPVNGQYIRNAHVTDGNVAWVKWDGFDASKFGWISDQKGGKPQGFVTDHANSVELQRDNDTDNTYAEIVGSEIGKSIYQKIDTQNSTDAVYTVRFDHAALSSEHADGMQALVNGKPVTMTRIGGNKAGDKTGWTGTDIVTHATNTDHYRHDGQWATYEGKVTIPANTPVSTFTFKSLNEAKPDMGNLIDNLTFKIAYRLSYDSNGGTKAKASQISSRAEGKASETDGKVKTVADDAATVANTTNTLPDHLVNGDFEYPVKSDMPVNDGKFWYISQNDGSYFAKGTVLGKRYKLPEGFDKAKFAWHSTQTGDTSYPDLERADDVQVNYKADGTNHYSEINAAQSGATIYQDVATVPGVMYKWSLKHASLDSSHLDKMSVIIGEPGKETAQEATRTTANGHGDKLGKVGTVISTKVSNPEMPDGNKSPEGAHTGQWETYTGTYIATGTVTRFAFRSVEGSSAWDGNLLDDISFSKAYKLTYDKNASDATGKVPSNQRGKENAVEPAESKTTGNMKTVADNTSNLPDHLVNGTFDYRGNEIINENQRVYGSHDTTYLAIISAKTGIIGNPLHSKLDNWDSGKFGWKSNDATAGVDTVEVQRRNHTPYPTNAGNVWGRDHRSQARQVHLPGHRHHARRRVQVEPQARVPQRGPGRQHAGHDRRTRQDRRTAGDPHNIQRVGQDRQRRHHDHHARHRAGRQVGDLYRRLPRHLDRHPVHVQERQGLQRSGPRLHRRGQLRRRPKLRQGVQALLRQEFFGRDRQRAIQSIRQGEHRTARQVQDHRNREDSRGRERPVRFPR